MSNEHTPEGFAPYLAQALQDATRDFHKDPNGPMNALVAGLRVFRDLIVQAGQLGPTPHREAVLPGFLILRRAIFAVMNNELELAREHLEQYAREHPQGTFAAAVNEGKSYPVMTLGVEPMKVTNFCRQCRQNQTFIQKEDNIFGCEGCGWEIRIVNRRTNE